MKFNTVLYNLRSAKNIGMIARSHISFGGNFLILVGGQERWKFKGGTHSYTRKIEDMGKLLIFDKEKDFFVEKVDLGIFAVSRNAFRLIFAISHRRNLCQ